MDKPNDKNKNSTIENVHRAIGQALDKWGRVETELFNLFSQLIYSDPKDKHARKNAVYALNAIISFDAKIKAIIAANKVANKDSKGFEYLTVKILAKTTKLSKKRNMIAHFKILRDGRDEWPESVFVCPYFEFFVDANTQHRLYYDDIVSLGKKFEVLSGSLHWLNSNLYVKRKDLRSEFQLPVPDLNHHIHFLLPHTGRNISKPSPQPQS